MGSAEAVCLFSIILLVGLLFLATAVRVVPEYQRLVIFRLGRPLDRAAGPGIVFMMPMMDLARSVDLREQVREMPPQIARSLDDLPISCTFRWYYKVLDPVKSVLVVGNHETTTMGMAVTALRAIIGEIEAKDIPARREYINRTLRTRLDEVTERWGVKVTNIDTLKLVIDDRQREIDEASSTVGTWGETQTAVHAAGTVMIGNQSWNAMSNHPIAPNTRVLVKRVVLEVEEDVST